MYKRILLPVMVVLLGVGSGFVGSLAGQHFLEDDTNVEDNTIASSSIALDKEEEIPLNTWLEKSRDRRIEALEEQMTALNEKGVDEEEAEAVYAPDPSMGDPEAAREQTFERWRESLNAFDSEPLDEEWAQASQASLETDIENLLEIGGFSLLKTECRTGTCSATVEWPSFGIAEQKFANLLHYNYKLPCGVETVLPDPEEEEAGQPYQATILYHCRDM